MKNLKYVFLFGLLVTFSCKGEGESDTKKFEEQEEKDCGCDDVDTLAVED